MGGEASSTYPDSITSARNLVKETFQDIILIILLENSNMTRKQFETFLIDALSPDFLNGRATSVKRPRLRTDRNYLSRGSFDRTLNQARENIVEAIYTVLLLGYTGLLETPQLGPFLEVSNRLKAYIDLRRKEVTDETRELVDSLSAELTEVLTNFLKRRGRE